MLYGPTEEDYDAIRKLGTKLHIPTPEMFWGFKVEDLNGNVLHEHDERGHSWVRNAYNVLVSGFCGVNMSGAVFGAGYTTLKAVDGTAKSGNLIVGFGDMSSTSSESSVGYHGALATATTGIIIGTGNSAYSFEDYKLATQITQGTSSGQMSHDAHNAIVKAYDSGSKIYTATHSRYFTNNSGASIIVSEAGLLGRTNGYGLYGNYLLVRDVLGTPITVADLARLTVTYTIAVTYPA